MNDQEAVNYQRIAEAIDYIKSNFRDQPDLDEVAEKVNLSPFHFQRLFTSWAGVSPKKFLQYTSIDYAKNLLKHKSASLFDVANETGLSGTGRLHDLFVKIEAMTPGEYKNGGENLEIHYSFSETPFGQIIIGSTERGICYLAFIDNPAEGLKGLVGHFPNGKFIESNVTKHKLVVEFFLGLSNNSNPIKLHIKGTEFQLKVWEALLKIPFGNLSTYGSLATEIKQPTASRAVGTAIGSNPIAYLIPCHRVIQSTGNFGGYMWGSTRKTAIIGWEAAKVLGTR